MKKLSKKEQQELKGGTYTVTTPGGDVKNNNSVIGCACHYNDNNMVENVNTVEGCKCNCLHKSSVA